jgi:hypothetical protein
LKDQRCPFTDKFPVGLLKLLPASTILSRAMHLGGIMAIAK